MLSCFCCLTLCNPVDCSPPGSSVRRISQARVLTGVDCHFILQGIFLTQGSKLCLFHLLHWQADSLPRSHLRSLEPFVDSATKADCFLARLPSDLRCELCGVPPRILSGSASQHVRDTRSFQRLCLPNSQTSKLASQVPQWLSCWETHQVGKNMCVCSHGTWEKSHLNFDQKKKKVCLCRSNNHFLPGAMAGHMSAKWPAKKMVYFHYALQNTFS